MQKRTITQQKIIKKVISELWIKKKFVSLHAEIRKENHFYCSPEQIMNCITTIKN